MDARWAGALVPVGLGVLEGQVKDGGAEHRSRVQCSIICMLGRAYTKVEKC